MQDVELAHFPLPLLLEVVQKKVEVRPEVQLAMDAILAQQGRERVLFTVDGAGTQELNPPSPPSFSLFDKIISKEIPVQILHEDELCMAFTNFLNPSAPVHFL
ncbi:hypothetical protein B484DRAFT_404580, partial [Ochromonadaceae sp. CCMP2298]